MEYYLQIALEHHVLNKLPTNTVQMAQSLSTFITTKKNDVQYSEEYSSTEIPGILFTAPVPGALHDAGGSLRSNNTEDTTTHSCNSKLMVRMYNIQTSSVSSHVKQKILFFSLKKLFSYHIPSNVQEWQEISNKSPQCFGENNDQKIH